MKKTLTNVAVLFSLVFTLVLTGGVATIDNTTVDANEEISTCSDLFVPNFPIN